MSKNTNKMTEPENISGMRIISEEWVKEQINKFDSNNTQILGDVLRMLLQHSKPADQAFEMAFQKGIDCAGAKMSGHIPSEFVEEKLNKLLSTIKFEDI